MIFPIPIYRFFSKEEYANDLVDKGIMRFTPTSAFANLENVDFKDEGEKYYNIKTSREHRINIEGNNLLVGGEFSSKYRRIDDAWAFCGTTSIVSSARKNFATVIVNFGKLTTELKKSLSKKFGEELLVMCGPVTYYDRHMDSFSKVHQPPYFCKPEKFKSDLEFRIVIIPTNKIYEQGNLEPIELEIENPAEIFEKTLIIDPKELDK